VVDGKEYEDDVVLNIGEVIFCFSKLSVTNYQYDAVMQIEISNNSNDTLFFNPSKIILYKNDELFQNDFERDSIYYIPPLEDKEIYYYSGSRIFDHNPFIEGELEPKEIKFGLLLNDIYTSKDKISFPLIRFVPEKDENYKPYKFLVN
jgi:hypothetical protein